MSCSTHKHRPLSHVSAHDAGYHWFVATPSCRLMETLSENPKPTTVQSSTKVFTFIPFHFFRLFFKHFLCIPTITSSIHSNFNFFIEMDSVKLSSQTPNLQKLFRTVSKLLRFRTSGSKLRKIKYHEKVNNGGNPNSGVGSNRVLDEESEQLWKKRSLEVVVAKVFASVSSIKAAYAQLQVAQAPYEPDEIQLADEVVVLELMELSELKQGFLKKQSVGVGGLGSQDEVLVAELKEQKSVVKSYEIMGKNFESRFRFKDSEVSYLKEKLEECGKQNELLEKELDPFLGTTLFDELELSELNVKHFDIVLRHCVESVRCFVQLIVSKMSSAGWDLDAAAESIKPGIVYGKVEQRCFAFEAFVFGVMFDGFQYPKFSTLKGNVNGENHPQQGQRRRQCWHFFDRFMELKSTSAMEMLNLKPGCRFGKFCRVKYLGLVHPKMELAFFSDLNQRDVVNLGGCPNTVFFAAFAGMAKHIWLLHCLALSFDHEISIFQVRRGVRYSEVFMENVVEEDIDEPPDPRVGFTVIPGFNIGKTVIQCQVYLSSTLTMENIFDVNQWL